MRAPSSTYRVQLNKDFTFRHLRGIVPYLRELGVSTIYASPVLRSRAGSLHGYDVVEPYQIDPEIGTLEEFRELRRLLNENGISWLQDIVPNHMAFHPSNKRLMDVLERGVQSPWYTYFDIEWDHDSPELKGKLMVPVLAAAPDECIDGRQIQLRFRDDGFVIDYAENCYPLSLSALSALAQDCPAIRSFTQEMLECSAHSTDLRDWHRSKREIVNRSVERGLRQHAEHVCDRMNADVTMLKTLLDKLYYRLTWWKETETRINYRRFFTVNELICLRMEDENVFNDYHRFLLELYRDGLIDGFRIDHIDGLFDPSGYVNRLRRLAGPACYIIAEKILEAKEDVPGNWPVEGTSGYEFLSYSSQLFTDRTGSRRLRVFYHELLPTIPPYARIVFDNKMMMLKTYMAGDWDNLVSLYFALGLGDHPREELKQAIGLLMASLPVYRVYPERIPVTGKDAVVLEEAFRVATETGRGDSKCLDHLHSLFFTAPETGVGDAILKFLRRMMQFTGPLTAKGVEDTTFYVYNPLISHDEVGDAPSLQGMSIGSFHSKMESRAISTPLSLNATSTHDTKRGEDARLRLNILSEIPDVWENQVREWLELNKPFRQSIGGREAPELNDEYLIYQSLLGGYPDQGIDNVFFERFDQFLVKALREAKVNSDWTAPDEAYEDACRRFLRGILSPDHGFATRLQQLVQVVGRYAQIYALGQVLIKTTAPGIPDIYQGCELWDLSFVDPDNRRPVDFAARQAMLEGIIDQQKKGNHRLFHFLRSRRSEGYEKLFVTWKALNFRKTHPLVFTHGRYIPLAFSGREPVAIGYARWWEEQWVLTMVPLALARNCQLDHPYAEDPAVKAWFELPGGAPDRWKNVFTGQAITAARGRISVFDAFNDFPVALFESC